MLGKELEATLNEAFRSAREQRHEFMTVEHLLLALLSNRDALEVLRACGADIKQLEGDLRQHLAETVPALAPGDERETQPTLGFQRVLQRSLFHVQSSGKKQVTGANVLVALFGEREAHAAYLLNRQSVTRLDVVNFISHGISKVPDAGESGAQTSGGEEEKAGEQGGKSPLESFAVNLNRQAAEGRTDPLIGRRHEVERTLQILCRRRKNNPLFVGDAGVGKTAIAEGLAKMIVEGDVPEVMEVHDDFFGRKIFPFRVLESLRVGFPTPFLGRCANDQNGQCDEEKETVPHDGLLSVHAALRIGARWPACSISGMTWSIHCASSVL